jgi:hypothetical protein
LAALAGCNAKGVDVNRLLEQAETLQNLLISHATGGSESDADYRQLRQALIADATVETLVPGYVRTCRTLSQFWQYIKYEFRSYAERRSFIWDTFQPLLQQLERGSGAAVDGSVSDALEQFDEPHINEAWSRALDRRSADPEGAITAARTLLESVCKHILEDRGDSYSDKDDLPRLYRHVSRALNLAPSQHTEEVFRQVLGGCVAVVEGLGTLRNRLSDAHGRGRAKIVPAARHAELAVNLAGAMAIYLIATHGARKEIDA